MRNFQTPETANKEVFRGNYADALKFAREKQAEVNAKGDQPNLVESYTIDGDETGEGTVTWNSGTNGAQVPYQPIVHSEN